ncbi:MAG: nucleotidyl transferase AbiEii/AbiGii toxin family protein [Rhodospirillales bacterium]|nr:nucleotidyl transferase AbiEii/AbiGii toxin family protein [Rhodospirillales bacterium]
MLRGSVGIEPLPEIDPNAEEDATMDLVARLMRAVADLHDAFGPATTVVMRGGTAARLAYGLTRPSRDIDLDFISDGRATVWEAIEAAAEHAGLLAIGKREGSKQLSGTLQLSDGRTPSLMIDVDVRRVHDHASAEAIREGRTTARPNGILTYRPEILAEQKLALTALPEPRLRAKDRYDIAWWLTRRIADVLPPLRVELDKTLRERPGMLDEWDRKHRLDVVTRRVDPATVRHALTTALEQGPVVLVKRVPRSDLVLQVGRNAGGVLTWRRTPDAPEPRVLGRFANDQDVQRYMTAYGIWQQRDVPALLRSLQVERARSRQQTP